MSNVIRIHPQDPQHRLIKQVVGVLDKGDVIAYPTDSGYALGCTLGNKSAMEKIRNIRKLSKHHHFTLMMKDLSHVGEYAKFNNSAFRLMKKILPGAYTFILEGAREVPNRLLHEKRKTIGIRISNHPIVKSLLDELTERVNHANLNFSNLNKGWRSDRGRIYIIYGPPDTVERYSNQSDGIYEIWEYPSGLKFIFLDRNGFGNFMLVRQTL